MTALQTLQEELISPSALAGAKNEAHHTLDTDVCGRQIWCALL